MALNILVKYIKNRLLDSTILKHLPELSKNNNIIVQGLVIDLGYSKINLILNNVGKKTKERLDAIQTFQKIIDPTKTTSIERKKILEQTLMLIKYFYWKIIDSIGEECVICIVSDIKSETIIEYVNKFKKLIINILPEPIDRKKFINELKQDFI